MKFSKLVGRISGDGADAWKTHYLASRARERGEDVILLSVGDPDLDTPAPVVERAIECLRAGDTHYTPATGREPLRTAIAEQHRVRSGQDVDAGNVIFLSGAQNALFATSLCVAGAAVSHVSGGHRGLGRPYGAGAGIAGRRFSRRPPVARSAHHPKYSRVVLRHSE